MTTGIPLFPNTSYNIGQSSSNVAKPQIRKFADPFQGGPNQVRVVQKRGTRGKPPSQVYRSVNMGHPSNNIDPQNQAIYQNNNQPQQDQIN